MAYDGWVNFNGAEFINLSRTVQLAAAMGITTVWTDPASVAWIEDALGGSNYDDVTEAPWYDPNYPASSEFAGFVPLAISGLDDSTRESSVTQYVGNGGNASSPRNSTLPIVASVALIASTDRGADYGKRWMDRLLAGGGTALYCSGSDLHYFRWAEGEGESAPPIAHRRDVSVTRAVSVTRKRTADCSTVWWTTFTWTANDPFEYGEEVPAFTLLGGIGTVTGPLVTSSGNLLSQVETSCPVYNYEPVYDPLYPALVAPPTVPDFYPAGWDIAAGDVFNRFWVRISPVEPSALNVVPVITFTAPSEARMVRFSIWPAASATNDRCDPLFTVILTYMPAGQQFVVDGEQQASYVWDGSSPLVRRSDSLVYGTEATPIDWSAFNDSAGLLVTLDLFAPGSAGSSVKAALSLVPKSD